MSATWIDNQIPGQPWTGRFTVLMVVGVYCQVLLAACGQDPSRFVPVHTPAETHQDILEDEATPGETAPSLDTINTVDTFIPDEISTPSPPCIFSTLFRMTRYLASMIAVARAASVHGMRMASLLRLLIGMIKTAPVPS